MALTDLLPMLRWGQPRPVVSSALRTQVDTLLKQSDTFPLIFNTWQRTQGVPRPESVATFADFARVFKREVWVYACVKRIAKSAASVPLKVVRVHRDGTEEDVEDHPLKTLLDSINPYMGPRFFFETLYANLEIFGNAYLEKVRRGQTGPPIELYPLRPDRMTIVPHPKNFIDGYLYAVNGRRLAFEAGQVAHLRTINPTDDYYGLSTLEAAALAVETDQYAIGYNRSFFKNNATPEGIMRNKTAVKEGDVERVKKEFDRLFKGAANAHRIAWLEGEWEWLQIGMRQRDAQFIDARKMSREEILAAFDMPPVMVGIFEFANYANSKEQQAIFWEVTMLPRLRFVEDELNEKLTADFGDGIKLRYDTSGIEALKEDEDAKTERAIKKVRNALLTPNEARQELGYQEVDNPAMDVHYLEFGLTPIEQAGQSSLGGPGEDPNADPEDDEPKGKAPIRKGGIWRDFQEDVARLESGMASAMRSYFVRQREDVVRRLHDSVLQDAVQLSANGVLAMKQYLRIEEILGTEADAGEELKTIAHKHLTLAVQRRGQRTMDRIRARRRAQPGRPKAKDDGLFDFNLHDPTVLRFLEQQGARLVVDITRTTREAIRQAVVEGQAAGDSVNEIQRRIEEVFQEAATVRSLRIARTEIIGASNFGQLRAMEQSGVVAGKQWLSARDETVRESHQAADKATDPLRGGRAVALNQPFDIGGIGMQYPGDQSAPPEETVNCRCVVLEVLR